MELLIALGLFGAIILVGAVAIAALYIYVHYFTPDQTPVLTTSITSPLNWVVRSSECILPVSWRSDIRNDEIDSCLIELIQVDPTNQNILSRIPISDLPTGELDIPTNDPQFFPQSGTYKLVILLTSQLGFTSFSQHVFTFQFDDTFYYQDQWRPSGTGAYTSGDRTIARRGITFVGSGVLAPFSELPDKQITSLNTCPKASLLNGIEYFDGYHIDSQAQPVSGVRLLKYQIRKLETGDIFDEGEISRQQRIDFPNPLAIEEGIEILIEMRDVDNPTGSIEYSRFDVKYHFSRVP